MTEKETKSCSDCIHFDVCYKIEHFGRDLEDTSPCKQFISKDVAPVRHGHWKKGKGNERPTENGFVHDDRYFCDYCGWGCCCDTKLDFRYCPNCGAKMDGGEGE